MVQLTFNASQVKPNTRPDPVPSAWYKVHMTASEQKPTKAADGSWYLQCEYTILEGEASGRKVYDRLNLKNQSEEAMTIAYGTLSAIAHCTGVIQFNDSQQLHGKALYAYVEREERDDKPGTFTNNITGYRDINGNEPGMAGNAGAQSNAAPSWAGGNDQGGGQQQDPNAGMQQQDPNTGANNNAGGEFGGPNTNGGFDPNAGNNAGGNGGGFDPNANNGGQMNTQGQGDTGQQGANTGQQGGSSLPWEQPS